MSMDDEYQEEVPFDPRFYYDFKPPHPDDASDSEDGEAPIIPSANFPRSTLDLVGNFLGNLLWPAIEHGSGDLDSTGCFHSSEYW